VNLAIGRRTFVPSALGKTATAIYIATGLLFMVFNYAQRPSAVLDFFVYLSLAVTILSSVDYMVRAARIINLPDTH